MRFPLLIISKAYIIMGDVHDTSRRVKVFLIQNEDCYKEVKSQNTELRGCKASLTDICIQFH